MRQWGLRDTIAAVATPRGKGAIGIVRVSGPLCRRIAESVFEPARASHPLKSHRFYYGHVKAPGSEEYIDEAMAVLMEAPRSYTREDCLEIQVHSGPAVVQEVLEAVIQCGARVANPGEFTLRAFLNGRIDLTQAEAVLDMVEARSRAARRLALGQLVGGLAREAAQWREELLDVMSSVEAGIDFPDEDLPAIDGGSIGETLGDLLRRAEGILETYRRGRMAREGARVMLIGPVNAGKSSLLNAMVGYERAIVTDLPGTTRDLVEEPLEWRGLPIRAIDTAGIREEGDEIERHGRRLLRERVWEADLLVLVMDSSREEIPPLGEVEEWLMDKPCIVAWNKVDLEERAHLEQLPESVRGRRVVRVSALKGWGVGELLDAIRDELLGGDEGEEWALTNARHRDLIARFCVHMGRARDMVSQAGESVWWELVAEELRGAMECLDELRGARAEDELLGRIFERFCIGK